MRRATVCGTVLSVLFVGSASAQVAPPTPTRTAPAPTAPRTDAPRSDAPRATRADAPRPMDRRISLDNTRIPEIDFAGVSLQDAFDFIRDVTGANMNVNWDALELVGIGRDTPVSLQLREATLRQIFRMLLDDAGGEGLAAFYVEDNIIEVTSREVADRKMYTKIYPVLDLLIVIPDYETAGGGLGGGGLGGGGGGFGGGSGGGGRGGAMTGGGARGGGGGAVGGRGGGGGGRTGGGAGFGGGGRTGGGGAGFGGSAGTGGSAEEQADELITIIQDLIQPEIWRDNGGVATIRYFQGNLIVTAPRSVHEAIGGPL